MAFATADERGSIVHTSQGVVLATHPAGARRTSADEARHREPQITKSALARGGGGCELITETCAKRCLFRRTARFGTVI